MQLTARENMMIKKRTLAVSITANPCYLETSGKRESAIKALIKLPLEQLETINSFVGWQQQELLRLAAQRANAAQGLVRGMDVIDSKSGVRKG